MDTALIRSAESTIRALGRLDPRPGQADVYGRWLGHLEDANRALEDILAAARGEGEDRGAGRRLEHANTLANRLAVELGLDGCLFEPARTTYAL
jgi:hypothetical protein